MTEIFNAGSQKMISFHTGQSQSLAPIDQWLLEASKFIKHYNSLPKSKREGLFAKRFPDQNSFYALDIEADEYANGFEEWLEVAPYDQTDAPQDDVNINDLNDLVILAHHYEHEEGPIVDWWNLDLKHILSKKEMAMIGK